MDEMATVIATKLADYGLLGIAVLVLGILYYRSQAEVKELNAQLFEQAKATTKALTENTAVMAASAAAQERAAEASRDLAMTIRSWTNRRGR